jgi:NitT/TauT family transport system permease protein
MTRKRFRAAAFVATGYLVLVVVWWLAARAMAGPASPVLDPGQLVQALWRLRSAMLENLTATASVAGWGLLLGAGAALVSSVLCVRFAVIGEAIHRMALILYALPLVAIAPALVILLGTGTAPRITIAALAVFFPVLVGAVDGLSGTSEKVLDMMDVLGATYVVTFLRARVPYALPNLAASMTVAAPSAVIGATIAEWVGASRGLGVSILYAAQSYQIDVLWASIATVTLLSVVAYAFFAVLGRRLFPWHASTARVEV